MSGAPSDELRELYERRAELQYGRPGAYGLPRALDRKFEGVWELVNACLPAEAVLDAGCGDGRYLAAFAEVEPRPRLAGCDIAERILETAAAACAEAGVEAELVRANLERLPFADGRFDLVLCSQVVEHLLEPQQGMDELARVLRPGGRLVVSTDNRRTLSRALNAPRRAVLGLLRLRRRRVAVEFPHRDFTAEELVGLLRAAGLTVERLATFRLHFAAPLNRGPVQLLLDRIDRAAQPHGRGDILAAVAVKGT